MSKLIATSMIVVLAGTALAPANEPEPPLVRKEHMLLKKFVGQWECENEVFLEPGKPMKSKASMTGRMIGDFWALVVISGKDEEHSFEGQATFGFDSNGKKKFIGTWVDSMTDYLWKYEGVADGNKLVLNTKGPNPLDPGKMFKARDTWEFKSKDLILLTTEFEGPDGKMKVLMKATCKRKM